MIELVTIALIAYIIVRELFLREERKLVYREREELTRKIMARSYEEYVALTPTPVLEPRAFAKQTEKLLNEDILAREQNEQIDKNYADPYGMKDDEVEQFLKDNGGKILE